MPNDSNTEIILGLNIGKSLENINSDISKINQQLLNDKNSRTKIIANLNLAKTTKAINDNLATISKNLKLDIGNVNIGNIQQSINTALKNVKGGNVNVGITSSISSVKDITSEFNKMFNISSRINGMLKSEFNANVITLLNNLKSAFNTGDIEGYQNALQKVTELIEKNTKVTIDSSGKEAIDYLRSLITDGSKVTLSDNIHKQLNSWIEDGRKLKTVLDEVFGKGQWNWGTNSTLDKYAGAEDYIYRMGGELEAIREIYNQIQSVESQNSTIFDFGADSTWIEDTIKRLLNLNGTVQDVALNNRLLAEGFIDIGTESNNLSQATTNIQGYLKSFEKTSNILDEVKSHFLSLTDASGKAIQSVSTDWTTTQDGGIDGFKVSVKEASGIVETFKYKLQETSEGIKYVFQSATGSDKLQSDIEKTKSKYQSMLAAFNSKNSSIKNGLSEEIQKVKIAIDGLGKTHGFQDVETAFNNLKVTASVIESNLKTFGSSLNPVDNAVNKMGEMPAVVQGIANSFEKLKQPPKDVANIISDLNSKINAVNSEQAGTVKWSERYHELGEAIQKAKNQVKLLQAENKHSNYIAKTANDADLLSKRVSKLTQDIIAYKNANSKAMKSNKLSSNGITFTQELDVMLSKLKQCSDPKEYQKIAANFRSIQSEIKAVGLAGSDFLTGIWDAIKKFGSWMSITNLVSSAVREVRQMVNHVVDLDTAMSDLYKTTDETSTRYSKFFDEASQKARDLKIDLSNLIEQTAEWTKKGYNLNQSSLLSESSGMYSVVGELDDATAVQHLTTVLKTYNMTVDESIDIVDKFNNISNKYSVTAADIGEALSNSVTSLMVAGNSLDEAISMATTITEVTGNASEAGNTLKVLSMRLRGASTEIEAMGESTDGMAESTSKLQSQIKALTNIDGTGGFDIMADADNFKSTYEIMEGISKVWDKMSDVNQADSCLYVQKCA